MAFYGKRQDMTSDIKIIVVGAAGRIKGHLADDQGQYLFENPGDVSLRLKKRKNQNKCR